MFKNFFFTITLLLLTTLLQDTHACTVQEPPPTTEESYNNHDLVFEGKVIGVDEPQDQSGEKNVTINITRIWKKSDSDEVSVNDPIKIYTAANSPLCGIMPRESESWTIFSGSSRRASNTESVISNKDITDALNELSPPPADDPPVEDPPVEDPPTCKERREPCAENSDCCSGRCNRRRNKCRRGNVEINREHSRNRNLRFSSVH